PFNLEAPLPAFVGCHQLDGQMLLVAKVDDGSGQVEAAHDPAGEQVPGPGVAGDLEVVDVPEERTVDVTLEQPGEQVAPGLEPPPRQIGDRHLAADRVEPGEGVGLIADDARVDNDPVGGLQQG